MDYLNKSLLQLRDLFQSMTPAARLAAVMLFVAAAISLAYLATHQGSAGNAYLMGGATFSPRELPAMEAAFAGAGLAAYEFDAGRIRVPAGQQHVYMAALAEADALPPNFGDILQRAIDSGGLFDDKHRRQERTKLATQRELSLTISSMTGIETAMVFYDEETTGGLKRETVRTASVSVRPVGSEPLNESLVPSIRTFVARAVAGLRQEDVAVTDLNSGRSFSGEADSLASPMDDGYLARVEFHEKRYKAEILELLSLVPGVIVTCNVELDQEKTHRETQHRHDPEPARHSAAGPYTAWLTGESRQAGYRGQVVSNASARLNGAAGGLRNVAPPSPSDVVSSTQRVTEWAVHPVRRVTVAVAVPESYFGKVWCNWNRSANGPGAAGREPDPVELDRIRVQEVAKIRACVAALLPRPADVIDPAELVTVTVFPDVKPAELPAAVVGSTAIDWLGRSWSTLGVIVLALVSLMMLRSLLRSTTAPANRPDPAADAPLRPDPAPLESSLAGETLRRDDAGESLRGELSDAIDDDPQKAADVLRNWIGTAT